MASDQWATAKSSAVILLDSLSCGMGSVQALMLHTYTSARALWPSTAALSIATSAFSYILWSLSIHESALVSTFNLLKW